MLGGVGRAGERPALTRFGVFMFLIFICKGKKMINKYLKSLLGSYVPWLLKIGIWKPLPSWNKLFIFCFPAIFVIVLNCGVEVVFAFNEKPEFSAYAFKLRSGLVEPNEISLFPMMVDRIEAGKFINYSCSEFGGGADGFLSLHNIDIVFMCFSNQFHTSLVREACAQSSTTKTSNDGRDSANNSNTFRSHRDTKGHPLKISINIASKSLAPIKGTPFLVRERYDSN